MVSTFVLYVGVSLAVVSPVAGLLATKWVGDALKRRSETPLLVRVLRLAITAVWVSVTILGINLAVGGLSFLPTLTFSAIAGVAVTLALQTTLQNILAGFILLRARFLRLGDIVQLGGVSGSVVSIGVVSVVLRLENGALAIVSNSNLLSGPLVNYTAATRLAGEY
jgi:small conductance mechanosensitive channel